MPIVVERCLGLSKKLHAYGSSREIEVAAALLTHKEPLHDADAGWDYLNPHDTDAPSSSSRNIASLEHVLTYTHNVPGSGCHGKDHT